MRIGMKLSEAIKREHPGDCRKTDKNGHSSQKASGRCGIRKYPYFKTNRTDRPGKNPSHFGKKRSVNGTDWSCSVESKNSG